MPRGSKPGERRGGRKKGTPNKVTSVAREAFLATFDNLKPDLERWVRETAEGWESVKVTKEGGTITVVEGRDPAKAADLVIRMAEYHFPKLGRSEVTGPDGGPVEFVIRDLAKGAK
jgi:hypothetical protein